MACLKCGRPLSEGQSFCDSCRQVMAQYPVKPDTVVHIIPRPAVTEEKKNTRKEMSAEKDLHIHLKSTIRWLLFTVGALTILVCLLAVNLLNTLQEPPENPGVIGQNYTVVENDN